MYDLPTSEELRRFRLRVRLTQTELAKKANLSQSLIARIEAGDIDPRVSTLRKILEVLKKAETAKKLSAEDLMISPVVWVSPQNTIGDASKLMEKHGISQLPVLENGIQVGSISETRVIKEVTSEKDISRLPTKKVRDTMNEGFPTVSRHADIETITKLTEVNGAVLVVDGGRVAGIITKADIIKLMKH